MNKLAIPAILVATVLVAGIFAFMPVEKASTVHNTIIGAGGLDLDDISNTQPSIQVVSGSGTGITDGDTVVIDCDVDFYVMDMYWEIDDFDGTAGERLRIGDGAGNFITIDGTALIAEDEDSSTTFDILDPSGTPANDVNVKISWAAVTFDLGAENFGDINLSTELFAIGAGANDIVITLEDNGDNFDASDTLTVTALIQTESNANCSVDVNT